MPERYKFWEKVDLLGADDCWEWTACKNQYGYGRISINGKIWKAHRYSWVLQNGPIPPSESPHGICVLHKCDNPSCVNPSHLFLGTHQDNIKDRVEKGRCGSHKGISNGRAKLTENDVNEIRDHYDSGEFTQQEIASHYGIEKCSVSQLVHYKTWAHI